MINEKDFLKDRINSIIDPDQKKYLYDILHDVFEGYAKYSDDKYNELENRIKDELPDDFDNYYIYTAVTARADLNKLSDFWFEAVEFSDTGGNFTELSAAVRVFANCGYEIIKPYLNQVITADVKTDKNEYAAVSLRIGFSKVYQDKIKRLYELFALNGKPWLTINCPFLFKFLDLTDIGGVIPPNETIIGYSLKNSGLSKYILNDMVLLWNVQGYATKSGVGKYEEKDPEINFFPAENMVLYEHQIKVKYPKSGYLFYGENLKNFYSQAHREKTNVISVISEVMEPEDIFVCRIANSNDGFGRDAVESPFAPQSNVREMRYADRQANRRRAIFTRGEIERICRSYRDISGSLRLAGVFIDDIDHIDHIDGNDAAREDYFDLNYFIETRQMDGSRKRLVFKFNALDRSDIFLYEKMWFLVSELQLYYNEYKCVGQII